MNAQTSLDTLTDEQLMQRTARDDTHAFDVLLLRHQRSVFHFIRRSMPGEALAEDLTQECFLRVWRARRSYLPTAMFRTWLFTIARRLALDSVRRAAEITSSADEVIAAYEIAGGKSLNPVDIVLARDLACAIDAAIDRMPHDLSETLILRDVEGMTYEQIAAIVGCPLGTVRSRLSAARKRLRDTISRWKQEL